MFRATHLFLGVREGGFLVLGLELAHSRASATDHIAHDESRPYCSPFRPWACRSWRLTTTIEEAIA